MNVNVLKACPAFAYQLNYFTILNKAHLFSSNFLEYLLLKDECFFLYFFLMLSFEKVEAFSD